MNQAATLGVGFCMFVYLSSSLFALIIFSDQQMTDTVLDNFQTTIMNPNTSTTLFVTMIIVLVCFLICSTMSIPLIFFSLKYTILNLVLYIKKNRKNTSRNSKGDKFEKLHESEPEDFEAKTNYNKNPEKENENLEIEKYKTLDEEISTDKDKGNMSANDLDKVQENKIQEDTLNANANADIIISKQEEEKLNCSQSEKPEFIIVKLSNSEEIFYTLLCYVSIVVVTLLIEKLEIVSYFFHNFFSSLSSVNINKCKVKNSFYLLYYVILYQTI